MADGGLAAVRTVSGLRVGATTETRSMVISRGQTRIAQPADGLAIDGRALGALAWPGSPRRRPARRAARAGAAESRVLTDGITDVLAGRRPLSEFDQVVKDWQNNGGNAIRTELQQSIAAAE